MTMIQTNNVSLIKYHVVPPIIIVTNPAPCAVLQFILASIRFFIHIQYLFKIKIIYVPSLKYIETKLMFLEIFEISPMIDAKKLIKTLFYFDQNVLTSIQGHW